MTHAIYHVLTFQQIASYTLRIEFDDGTSQVIDFEPILSGELFGRLRDTSIFSQVRIDPAVRTLVWPNGADFDPETLHDWPRYADELATRARQWKHASRSSKS
jgi:hypothetical protein